MEYLEEMIKMKYLYILILLFIYSYSYGQEYKVVNIKGYYMVSYEKNEIIDKYENLRKKALGQSCGIAIDFSTRAFFIPTQINDSICNFENISREINKFAIGDPDSVYIIPKQRNINNIVGSKFLSEKNRMEYSILSNVMDLSPYYIIDSNTEYLFRCIYIEGLVRLYKTEGIEKEDLYRIIDLFGMYTYFSRHRKQELFILEKINSYTPYIEDERFSKWLPYLEQ